MLEWNAKGLLFIGDPHASSRKPGRRLDEDFRVTVANKLEQAMAIAAERDWQPVILGDLFDDERDSQPQMMTLIIRALSMSPRRPITLVGNHEKTQHYLTDDTVLAALREARVIDTLEKLGPRAMLTTAEGKKVMVGGSPYGQEIPQSVKEWREQQGADWVIWLTHHDLAFEGAYPGALPIPEIEGAEMLINGHMHKPTAPVKQGAMVAFNPGNITRMSVDCRDQAPAVWGWEPRMGQSLERIELRHQKDIFSLEGLVFEAAEAASVEEARAELSLKQSRFASLLKQRQAEDAAKTQDATFLREDMEALFVEMAADDEFKSHMLDLLDEAMRDDET